MKFKIGDKVEVIGPLRSANDIRVGDIGVITDSMIGNVLEYQSKPIYRVDDKVCGWVGEDAIVSRASDKPKLWCDMTPEEKGALLLAAHEGKVIEGRNETWDDDCWMTIPKPAWCESSAYRVRPEPNVEVMTLYGGGAKRMVWCEERRGSDLDTHRITFNTIDGKPDCASIKMEAL